MTDPAGLAGSDLNGNTPLTPPDYTHYEAEYFLEKNADHDVVSYNPRLNLNSDDSFSNFNGIL